MSLYEKIIALAAKFTAAITVKANKSDLAPDYNASETYAVDKLVIKDGVLQKCITAGVGDSAQFAPTSVGSVIESVSSTPAKHASSHAAGGTDAITPFSIGAVRAYPYVYISPADAITLTSFSNNQFDLSASGISSVSVSIGDALVANTQRDLWFVLKSNSTAPDIAWDFDVSPEGEDLENLQAEDGSTNIFLISEYAPNKFMVARQIVST